jgi:hypothetical protein
MIAPKMVMPRNFQNDARRSRACTRTDAAMNTPMAAQHALLASIDRETKLAVARAYRARRQRGELDHLAYLAALEAFHAARPGTPNADAGQAVRLIIARAAQVAPEWFWRGVAG